MQFRLNHGELFILPVICQLSSFPLCQPNSTDLANGNWQAAEYIMKPRSLREKRNEFVFKYIQYWYMFSTGEGFLDQKKKYK